jgi:hypothetical protein
MFVLQILCKRYEHEHPRAEGRFVRKIYVGKSKQSKLLESCCTLAVITYFWKGGNPAALDDVDVTATPGGRNKRVSELP